MNKQTHNYIDLLDKMLLLMAQANDSTTDYALLSSKFEEIPENLRLNLWRYLEHKGYAFKEVIDKVDGSKSERTLISIQGFLFLEKGGFKSQYKAERAKYNWTIAKTIANVANAVIIILLGILAIVVSNKSNQQEKQIQVYEDSIHKLNTILK